MAEYYAVHFGNTPYNVVYGNYYPPGGGPPPAFTIDSTSNKPVPASTAEWIAFLASIGSSVLDPTHLWLFQEASGSIADVVGANPLSATGAPAYSKTIAGWTRKAVGGAGVAAASSVRNLAMTDTATTSFMVFLFARFDTPAAVVGTMLAFGNPSLQLPVGTNKIRLRENANLLDSTSDHNSSVHPLLLCFNNTGTTVKLYTDLEKLSITYSASIGAAITFTLSSASEITSKDMLYAASWSGLPSEISDADAKTLITGFGFSPPWT